MLATQTICISVNTLCELRMCSITHCLDISADNVTKSFFIIEATAYSSLFRTCLSLQKKGEWIVSINTAQDHCHWLLLARNVPWKYILFWHYIKSAFERPLIFFNCVQFISFEFLLNFVHFKPGMLIFKIQIEASKWNSTMNTDNFNWISKDKLQ